MLKKLSIILLVTGFHISLFAQVNLLDSLNQQLNLVNDTSRIKILQRISNIHNERGDYSNALSYKFEALLLAEKINNPQFLFLTLFDLALYYVENGSEQKAETFAQRAESIALTQGDTTKIYEIYDLLGGIIYFNQGKYDESFKYGLKLKEIVDRSDDKLKMAYVQAYLGDIYRVQEKYEEAISVYENALKTVVSLGDKGIEMIYLNNIAVIYDAQKRNDKALAYYKLALTAARSYHSEWQVADYTSLVAAEYLELDSLALAETAAKESMALASQLNHELVLIRSMRLLEKISFLKNDFKNAYFFSTRHRQLSDSLNSKEKQAELSSFQAKYEIDRRDREISLLQETNQLQSKIRTILIVSSALLIVGILLVGLQYRTVRKTLLNLKSTQIQLIQSEKMASLGELTAGIAHEIQNPLNFVNNFSEVSNELIDEMKAELTAGNWKPATEISDNLKQNLEKINFHGKRADAIVKSMLQHSRTSSGKKELTDINVLCDEYLRLAYHGYRAKDKSFNAKFESRLDPTLPKVNVVAQDVGRVVLNLINNAFYAVNEKAKQGIEGYEPTVTVSTTLLSPAGGGKGVVQISVNDNGPGIPDHIKEKIFQPFFTTKPTGQGTGLGLSLSYDIVTKGHGGELKATTQEGSGSEFIITLPT